MNSESIYQLIFENVNDGVLVRDAATLEIIDANPRFCEIMGISRDELLATPLRLLDAKGTLSSVKRLLSHFKRARQGRPQIFEWEVFRKNDDRTWVEINLREAIIDGRTCFISVVRDISDRKRMERLLQDSQQRFFDALESFTDIFFLVDYDWIIRYGNREFERAAKKNRDAMIGKNLWEVLPKMGGTVFQEKFFRAAQEKTPLSFEAGIRGRHWNEVAVYPSPTGLSIYIRNIAKRKEAEQGLRDVEQRYRAIFENSMEGIFQTTPEGAFITANPACAHLFGYESPEELIGAVCRIGTQVYVNPDERQKLLQLLKNKGKVQGFETRLRHKDGQILHVSISAQAVSDREGRIIAYQGTIRDVSEIREAWAAHQKSEQRYRELVESANNIILRLDPRGTICFFNRYAQQFFGFSEDEAIGKPVTGTILPETDSSGQDLRKLFDLVSQFPEEYGTHENENVRKDGERVWVSWTNTPVYGDDGILQEILCVGNDATERKRLEEQLRHAQKIEAVGTLAGGIAHDFNNILAVMIGNIELAGDEASEETRHYLQQALNAGLRGRDTIRQILTFSRKGDQKSKGFHVIPLLRELIKMLRASLPTIIEISLNIATDRDMVRGDPTQIQQVVMNLCANAKDAMPTGGLLEISLDEKHLSSPPELDMRPGRYLVLKIRDTGQGIDNVVRQRIFEPFFTTKEPGKGTGMGLALAYSIIRGLNGVIEVESRPGKGSLFTIYLPSMQHRTASQAPAAELPLFKGSESILLVDDEEGQLETGKNTLESLGYKVRALSNSSEALEVFSQDPHFFDLVITDQMMPLMSGTTLARHILALRPEMPIIVITGFSETVSPRTARSLGIREFAMKPLIKRELAETVRRVLDQGGG